MNASATRPRPPAHMATPSTFARGMRPREMVLPESVARSARTLIRSELPGPVHFARKRFVCFFDALSSREPVPTSLENALPVLTRFPHANRYRLARKRYGALFRQDRVKHRLRSRQHFFGN